MKLYSKRGQISIDAVLAILFMLLLSVLVSYNVFNFLNGVNHSEIADRGHSILDVFENYALIAYSKNVNMHATFKPIGNINYTIYFSNKKIIVNNTTNILFKPEHDENGTYINITGGNLKNNPRLPQNIVNISFGKFYVCKNLTVRIK
ncbi:hypothetical protein [Methanothermococcus sp.]|uniref:hypothetical protein n=1 Tax=Methanothermococcus sp. TaxID=2614238 RepID=UPI0025D03DC5|nr:hypothetical protein [Methanothermococcus sp.]